MLTADPTRDVMLFLLFLLLAGGAWLAVVDSIRVRLECARLQGKCEEHDRLYAVCRDTDRDGHACPKCGAGVADGAGKCEACGVSWF